ncbi:MAG: MerR family DNA-binding protein [Phormidesmis sp. CAN_BIN44]|nr:MerR family DNA-binding protein [Phormidesmis sp. CAN_BIN44]
MVVQEETKLIGSIAKQSGIPIKTIRYYEELGLLKTMGRTEGGFRLFSADVFARLNFIKRAQKLGLSLLEIREFLEIHDQGDLPCDHVQKRLRNKLIEVDRQIQQLQILRQELERLLAGEDILPKTSAAIICPIIEQV